MSLRRTILSTAVFFFVGYALASAQEVEPGSTFRLGVHFEIEDGWHIYWRNPGGAGLATAIEFDLPAGCVASPLQWPLPITFVQSEGIPGYGYEGSVVLAAEVSVPADIDRSQPGMVRAEVSWLACKGICVLGSTELEASLSKLPEDPVFRHWAGQLPNSSVAGDLAFSLSATGGLADGVITHWLRWKEAPRSVEWFPNPSDALEIGDVINELPSLFVVTGDNGERRGWELSVELTNN